MQVSALAASFPLHWPPELEDRVQPVHLRRPGVLRQNGSVQGPPRRRPSRLRRCHDLEQGTAIDDVESKAKQRLEAANFKPDYFSVCDAESLEAPSPQTKTLVILAAAWMGKTRLIDNLRFDR